jgi:hypothetical protein
VCLYSLGHGEKPIPESIIAQIEKNSKRLIDEANVNDSEIYIQLIFTNKI